LFGPGPIRAVLLGGVRSAQALMLRALALGAQVTVQTARPYAWEPFLRGVSVSVGAVASTSAVALVPPGSLTLGPASASAPQLVIVDVGPVGPNHPVPAAAWRAGVVLRDEVNPEDADLVARADLVLLQPLSPDEAELVAPALGLAEGREW